MSPDVSNGIGEVVAIVVSSALTGAVMFLRGVGNRKRDSDGPKIRDASNQDEARTKCTECDNPDVLVAVSKIPELHEDIKKISGRLDYFIDTKWDTGISKIWDTIQQHDREIGTLQGILRMRGDDPGNKNPF